MCYPGPGLSQPFQFILSEMDSMGKPHILPHPSQALHVLQGPHPETLRCEPFLVLCLSQMGVEPDSQLSGQLCRFL